jgi:hypothetical protein
MAEPIQPPVRRLKVGVPLFVRNGEQSPSEGGMFQNGLFLAMLLRRVPSVDEVYFVLDGGTGGARRFAGASPVPMIEIADAASRLDVVIEMSAQLGREWIAAFRARGGKVVSMRVGNEYVLDVERVIFDRRDALPTHGGPYDEIWTLPEYELGCASYYRGAMRAPVRIVPPLWSPLVLQRAIGGEAAGPAFDYQPGRRRWRVGIFEPNLGVMETSHIPMLCCEAAHRLERDMLEHVWVYNTLQMKQHAGFFCFANSLDIVKHGLASFEGGFPLHQVMSRYVDAVVAHQWENARSDVYYEALYGGYPLIHNSRLLGGCGYRYGDFDCEEGGRALLDAFRQHDGNLDAYRGAARAFLRTLDPEHEPNVKQYGDALDALCARTHGS